MTWSWYTGHWWTGCNIRYSEDRRGLGGATAYSGFQAYSAYSTILDTLNEVWQISILVYLRNVASQQKYIQQIYYIKSMDCHHFDVPYCLTSLKIIKFPIKIMTYIHKEQQQKYTTTECLDSKVKKKTYWCLVVHHAETQSYHHYQLLF